MTNQSNERRNRAHVPTNAFEAIGLPALCTTAELRLVNNRARIRQAMSSAGPPDTTAQTAERLLNDPGYRLREAAAWYFAFGTTSEAAASHKDQSLPHDRTLVRWQLIREDLAKGEYSPANFEHACEATAQLLNNPATWQPLYTLVREIADPRVGPGAIAASAQQAVERWICGALFTVALSCDGDTVSDAVQMVRAQDLAEDAMQGVAAAVLAKAAGELTSAAAECESRTHALLEQIESDSSVSRDLIAEADALIAATDPWWALVDLFDDDPDSGEEGRALDRINSLLRRIAVALVNRANDFAAAKQLLAFTLEIAQSAALRSSLEEDLRRVRYLEACQDTANALRAGDVARAEAGLLQVQRCASTDEDHAEEAKLQLLVQRLRSAGPALTDYLAEQQPRQGEHTGGGGAARTVWNFLVGLVVVAIVLTVGGLIIGAVAGAFDQSSSPSGEGIAPARDLPVGNSGEDERIGIEGERSRLEGVKSDLENLSAQIDRLALDLDQTQAQYPDGLPPGIFEQYEADRRRHNRLVAEYNHTLEDYQSDLDAFNRRVDEYNRR